MRLNQYFSQLREAASHSWLRLFTHAFSEYLLNMYLLCNMLSRLVITFLPRSKHLLISWLQSLSTLILEPPKIKSAAVSTVSPSICHEVMLPDAMILLTSWQIDGEAMETVTVYTFGGLQNHCRW